MHINNIVVFGFQMYFNTMLLKELQINIYMLCKKYVFVDDHYNNESKIILLI